MPCNSYKYASPDRYPVLKEFARENRRNPTVAEVAIWGYLSGRKTGYGFRRQQIIGDYIVDFVCLEKKLVVEIDGKYHFEEDQLFDDQQRTAWLIRMGFTEIRFTNEEVYASPETVADRILKILQSL